MKRKTKKSEAKLKMDKESLSKIYFTEKVYPKKVIVTDMQ